MLNTLRGYSLKASEALYGATAALVLAFCAFMFLLALVAIAVDVKAIDVQQIHTASHF